MGHPVIALLWWAAAAALAGEPERSPACRAALDRLAEPERALAAAPDDPALRAAWQAARARVARACLGGEGADRPARPPVEPPPTSVPPVAAPAAPARAPATVAPPLPRPAPPLTLGACDPSGCWASDGSRLSRSGPHLVGPPGLCTVQGRVLTCR